MNLSTFRWFIAYSLTFGMVIFSYVHAVPTAKIVQSVSVKSKTTTEVATKEFVIKDTIAVMPKEELPSAPIPKAILPVSENISSNPGTYDITVHADGEMIPTYTALLERLVQSPFFLEYIKSLPIELTNERTEPRGKMNKDGISLTANIASAMELAKVFTHELGHVVDVNILVSGTFTADPSEVFYGISWNSNGEKQLGVNVNDFVSGYALTNKYEDFAETYNFYIFHNNEFKKRSQSNESLARKYAFMANEVFSDGRFQGTSFESEKLPEYIWDTTKTPISLNKYLFFIK